MNKYEQIVKLAEAAALIEEVLRVVDSDFENDLQDIVGQIADIADAMEDIE